MEVLKNFQKITWQEELIKCFKDILIMVLI